MTIDAIIGGAQKAGTTTLLRYLEAHPSVNRQLVDELGGLNDSAARLGTQEFEDSWFDSRGHVRIGKLAGLMYQPATLRRFNRAYPSALHALVLRDPIDRANSAYWYNRRRGIEPAATLIEAITLGPNRFSSGDQRRLSCDYLRLSRYDEALESVLSIIDQERLIILEFDSLLRGAMVVRPLMDRLGLDSTGLPPDVPHENAGGIARSQLLARAIRGGGLGERTLRRLLPRTFRRRVGARVRSANVAPAATSLDGAARELLVAELAPSVKRLRGLVGPSIGQHWSI